MSTSNGERNFYEVLHVSRNAPVEIIRGSYRTLMQQLRKHPDLGGDTADAALINEAYAVLSNADRRAEYDAQLRVLDGVARGVGDDPPAGEPPPAREAQGPAGASHEPPPEVEPQSPPPDGVDLARQCAFCGSPHRHGTVTDPQVSCAECGSPLRAAEESRGESSDHRTIVRIEKQQAMRFFVHWPQPRAFTGRTEDISLNGLRLVTRQQVASGQRIRLVSPVIEAVGMVARSVPRRSGWSTDYVLGVSFITLRLMQSTGGLLSKRI